MSVEQIKALNELAQTVGIPAFIIVVFVAGVGLLFVRFMWPWITKRIEKQDAEYSERHKGYIAEQKANIEENKATTQVLIAMQQKLDGHEVNAVRRSDESSRRDVDLRELVNRRFDELLNIILEMRRK